MTTELVQTCSGNDIRFLRPPARASKDMTLGVSSSPSAAPPDMPNFAGKPDCDAGHKPWPRGTCLKCAPANVVIRAQNYRHTDTVSVPPQVVQQFYVK